MVSLLATTYFGPVQWYQKLNQSDRCLIECHDHFIKQTYRNRCVIATTNGLQALTVPIERFEGAHCAMLNIRISDHGSWRHLHWNALQSAYGESPFFEFYADDIRPFFERQWEFLVDFNMEITQKMCSIFSPISRLLMLTFQPKTWVLPTIVMLSARRTRYPITVFSRAAIIRYMSKSTAFNLIFLSSTCYLMKAQKLCYTFKG